MPKKSHKRAAKYSELSKSRRKRQAVRPGPQAQVVATAETQEVVAATIKSTAPKTTAAQKGPRTQPGLRLAIPDYKYVRNDLKRVGILTSAVIVIIIILAFVLG